MHPDFHIIAMQLSQILENNKCYGFDVCNVFPTTVQEGDDCLLSLLYYGILKARLIKTDYVETCTFLVFIETKITRNLFVSRMFNLNLFLSLFI